MGNRAYRILHFLPSFAIGGQQRRLAAVIEALGEGFEHRIESLDGDLSARALLDGARASVMIEAHVLKKSPLISLTNIGGLRRLIGDAKADLVCTYNFGSIEAIIANRLGPRIAHVHHEDGFGPDEAGGRQKATRVFARRRLLADCMIAVPSHALEEIARNEWHIDPARIRRIAIGVDVVRFRPGGGLQAGPVIVGALGALRREKNFARLIRCFAAASADRDARLVIYGEGPERPRLEAAIRSSSAAERMELAGATAAPERVLPTFHLFALSSDTEQTPISLIEAMASGLPAVATDVGDVRRMIGEAGADFVVAPDDEAAFVDRLRRLIDDAALRGRLGAANAARAAMFDRAAMIDGFRRLYLEAMGVSA